MKLEDIPGIGDKIKTLLNKLEIFTVDDLVNYYPFRYEIIKRSNIDLLKEGDKIIIDGAVEGQPTLICLNPKLKKIILRINTGRNVLNITIYNRDYLISSLKSGVWITVIGKYNKIKNSIIAEDIRLEKLPSSPKIESVYHTTAGLSRKGISKYITSLIMDGYKPNEILPDDIINKYNLLSKYDSIIEIHNPEDIMLLKKARQRLKYEELFLYLFKINYLKNIINRDNNYIKRSIGRDKIDLLISKLPYELTTDQKISLDEILTDLKSEKRMNRLLQGDVGCGKTIIALLSAYYNFLSGYQSAIMVPTEILAHQHYDDAKKLFNGLELKVALLTSSIKNKKNVLEELKDGKIDIVIGTQSLIQEDVVFKNLGLIITDEQHRFGVNQRLLLQNKGIKPDILSMSATPIPRTYALTIYGDMDISSIKTMPDNRKAVKTYFKKEKEITSVLELMKTEILNHHQIYVIAPMIENGNSEVENVNSLINKMNKAFSKIARISSIHGKLNNSEKEAIMKDYEDGKIDILISTTIIEVGVNVANASMIVIFDANYFGLSTIHQLRGRVGRSNIQSYCVLVAKDNYDKLKMLEDNSDGFAISEYDFKNRGEGELFGTKQSGNLGLKLANIRKDYQMLTMALDDVINFLPKYLENPQEYPFIKEELDKLYNIN